MEFILIASAHFLALLSPGPDFFLVMQAALRLPLPCVISICAGITVANAVYLLFAVMGLEMVREMAGLFVILKYLGSMYLVFIGIMLLRAKPGNLGNKETVHPLHQPHFARQFLIGFMSAILNPKNAVFYLALFTAMVSRETPLALRLLYAGWMVLVVFLWDAGLAFFLGKEKFKARLGKGIYLLEKMSGIVLVLFGICLPLS